MKKLGKYRRTLEAGLPRHVALLSLLVLLAGQGCKEGPPPSYVRVAGPAPALNAFPPSRAHLVVFWASWCAPCREETSGLRELANSPPEGLRVVVFSHDSGMAPVERFLGGAPEAALHLRLDIDEAAANAFGVERLPTSLLVVDGRLVARFEGPREWDSRAMRNLLERLLQEAPAR